MDFNAMDNRKCTICDFVFDQDCDDCPIMPSQIRSRHHPTRTQGVAHKGANRMTNKTAIEKAKADIDEAWEMVQKLCRGEVRWHLSIPADEKNDPDLVIARGLSSAREALSALEAEKPAEDAESLLDSIFDAIKENGITTNHNYGMRLTKESHDACIKIISAYHFKQCQICQRNELPDFARFENRSSGTTDVDK